MTAGHLKAGSAIFSFLVEATPPEGAQNYSETKRYGLIVFVRANTDEDARPIARTAIAKVGWRFPEVKEIARLDGKTKLTKYSRMNLEGAIRAAARGGYSVVVYDEPVS